MNIEDYLIRIKCDYPIEVREDVLFKLQKSHLLNVPFENLDIHYNKKISLSISEIYDKVVVKRRGGFCYELNGLFCFLLKRIGFNARLISAKVHVKNNEYSPEFDHMAIIVSLHKKAFLVDVGFGRFSMQPLELKLNTKIFDNFGIFNFDNYEKGSYRISEIRKGQLIPQYIFKNKERQLSDFEKRSHFHQTSKESHFTQQKMISIATEYGRITLNNSKLKRTHLETEKVIAFKEEAFEAKLKHYFNIEI